MIDEHNIEQRIFEYHEGLMDASQKQDLMEYLHQYPEYQRDFAIWAQARLHDEGVATPVFQEKLMKPTAWIPSTMLKWSAGIGALSMVCLLAVVFYPKTEIPKKEIIKTIEKQTNTSAPVEKTVIFKAQNQTFKKKIKPQEQTIPTVSLSEEAKTETKINELKLIQKEEVLDIKETPSEQTILSEETTEERNTDDSNYFLDKPNDDESTQDEEPIQTPKAKKLKRPKQKMSLKPNADILPTSPNF